jgi:hypothetical protein
MYITTCFAYNELKLVLRSVQESIAVQLKSDKNVDITVTLQPIQCKILGEALLNAAGSRQVGKINGKFAGSMQVDFDLETEQEEVQCQLQDLSALTGKKSLFRIA